jgi:hypothetical protein
MKEINELESLVLASAKHSNNILQIEKVSVLITLCCLVPNCGRKDIIQLRERRTSKTCSTAFLEVNVNVILCMHVIKLKFRRIFSKFFETGSFSKPKAKSSAIIEKVDQYRSWLLQRYASFKSELYKLALHESLDIQAPVIRTIIEVKRIITTNIEFILITFTVRSIRELHFRIERYIWRHV